MEMVWADLDCKEFDLCFPMVCLPHHFRSVLPLGHFRVLYYALRSGLSKNKNGLAPVARFIYNIVTVTARRCADRKHDCSSSWYLC